MIIKALLLFGLFCAAPVHPLAEGLGPALFDQDGWETVAEKVVPETDVILRLSIDRRARIEVGKVVRFRVVVENRAASHGGPGATCSFVSEGCLCGGDSSSVNIQVDAGSKVEHDFIHIVEAGMQSVRFDVEVTQRETTNAVTMSASYLGERVLSFDASFDEVEESGQLSPQGSFWVTHSEGESCSHVFVDPPLPLVAVELQEPGATVWNVGGVRVPSRLGGECMIPPLTAFSRETGRPMWRFVHPNWEADKLVIGKRCGPFRVYEYSFEAQGGKYCKDDIKVQLVGECPVLIESISIDAGVVKVIILEMGSQLLEKSREGLLVVELTDEKGELSGFVEPVKFVAIG